MHRGPGGGVDKWLQGMVIVLVTTHLTPPPCAYLPHARVALPAEAVRGDPGTSCATQPCHVMIMLCSKSPVLVITDTKSSMEM